MKNNMEYTYKTWNDMKLHNAILAEDKRMRWGSAIVGLMIIISVLINL